MKLTIDQIAEAIEATVEGDGSAVIEGLSGLQEAGPGELSFLANPRYASAVAGTKASAVIVARDWQGVCPCPLIRVDEPDKAFAQAAGMLLPAPPRPAPGIHPTAVLAGDVEIGDEVSIGPCCVLEAGVEVGDGTVVSAGCYLGQETIVGNECRLYPNVSTRERTRIGNRVVIHNGSVIGSDGFGYFPDEKGRWQKIPQVGTVEIGDDVEIGANVTVDRARFGKTVIGDGVKIDNLVQVAHNVCIGEHTAIAAQTGISGSTTVGRHVRLAGQVGVAGHVDIGDGAVAGAQAGVTKNVPAGMFVSGYPAVNHKKAGRIRAHLMRLPQLKKKVNELSRRLSDIEQARDAGQADQKTGNGS
jgi:UDP-3-O-[3-hydroxymyristoyl] glucosamine N-acyltransferase